MKRATIFLAALALSPLLALAKLPALDDAAKAKAAEAAAKTAWQGKVDAYQLCKAQDRVAAGYFKANKSAKPGQAGAACADPGAFVYTPPGAAPAAAPAAPAAQPAAKKS